MVSRLTDKAASAEELRTYHTMQLSRLGPQRSSITGMLTIYPTCITHILEGPYPVLLSLLREIAATYETTSILGPRVIYSSEGTLNFIMLSRFLHLGLPPVQMSKSSECMQMLNITDQAWPTDPLRAGAARMWTATARRSTGTPSTARRSSKPSGNSP